MNWYSVWTDKDGKHGDKDKSYDIAIHPYHQMMSESCEVTGLCAIAEATEHLEMVIELWLNRKNLCSRFIRFF